MREFFNKYCGLFILGLAVVGASCFNLKRDCIMMIVAKNGGGGNIKFFKLNSHIGVQEIISWEKINNVGIPKNERGAVTPSFMVYTFTNANNPDLNNIKTENDFKDFRKKYSKEWQRKSIYGWKDSKTRHLNDEQLNQLDEIIAKHGKTIMEN